MDIDKEENKTREPHIKRMKMISNSPLCCGNNEPTNGESLMKGKRAGRENRYDEQRREKWKEYTTAKQHMKSISTFIFLVPNDKNMK